MRSSTIGLLPDLPKKFGKEFALNLHKKTNFCRHFELCLKEADDNKHISIPLPESPAGPGWIGYSQHAFESLPLPTEIVSSGEVLGFRDWAFDQYFTNPKYLSFHKQIYIRSKIF